jgi:hypothetical protein
VLSIVYQILLGVVTSKFHGLWGVFGYKPIRIIFLYNVPKTKNNKDGRMIISFDDWIDIIMVEHVMERMEKELAK